ncbi:MAG: hypothetical protein DHS20C05_09790 [Hyphococcus sp.]|nr:MAG: hypothetical protein DHS20C05_09790 [Marinicaulis sp.]
MTMSKSARIVLVDDDPILRELAHEQLRNADYDVEVAENGEQALELLNSNDADLVITDLDMPVMGGLELTEKIRAEQNLKELPVIVITASDHADAVDRAFAAGATSFLSKPINWTLFNHAVLFVLKASEDQKALRVARDQAEAGAKFKDSLMSVMSHELRTPLNAIIGFGQLLGEQFATQNDDLNREYADYVVDGGKRLLNNISDMLLASEARSGEISLEENSVSIGDVIDEARSLALSSIRTTGAKIKLTVQDRDLELHCDSSLMARALSKLIDNAAKFSPRGGAITIGAALTKAQDLAILVKDNGAGIAPEKLKEITAPFAQSDMSLRRSKEGLGLGIPLAQAIIAAHGAKLRIESKEGEGLRALIIMPSSRVLTQESSTSGSAKAVA